MKITTLRVGTLGVAGLVTTGLLALPLSAATAGDQLLKRDDDTPDVVLVSDDDDDDTVDRNARSAVSNTGSRDDNTRTGRDNTGSRDNSRTGSRSGRDNSYSKQKRDWTTDGPGKRKIDWSQNQTNDRSRNNTRG